MTNRTRAAGSAAVALAAGAVLALAPALSASAHVSASASSTAAGSYTVITFSVPHGCEGSPTVGLEIEIPETIISVTPTVNPNWTVSKTMVPLDTAQQDAHGGDIIERVGSITYTASGDGLPDGYRDTVALSLQLPDGDAGDVISFPTLQSCAEGSVAWTGDDAPSIVLTAPAVGGGHGDRSDAGDDGDADAADDPSAADDALDGDTDVLARVLGIAALALGAVGVVLAIMVGRTRTPEEK